MSLTCGNLGVNDRDANAQASRRQHRGVLRPATISCILGAMTERESRRERSNEEQQ